MDSDAVALRIHDQGANLGIFFVILQFRQQDNRPKRHPSDKDTIYQHHNGV